MCSLFVLQREFRPLEVLENDLLAFYFEYKLWFITVSLAVWISVAKLIKIWLLDLALFDNFDMIVLASSIESSSNNNGK